ncbi:MAG: zinc metalloprotease [Bacteroidetes bacterium]|nr:MAG: zinc metalloprotease [Bacteroidota bacterium]
MKKVLLFIGFCLLLSPHIYAQKVCAANNLLTLNRRQDASVSSLLSQVEEYVSSYIRNYPFNPQLHRSAITIPVVVHVVYKNATENISDAQINAQIDILNRDYRMRNTAEINAAPAAFRPLAADCYIQFQLARRSPTNAATTGITRTSTTVARFNYSTDNIKTTVPPWDTNRYLNIWVGDIFDDDPGGFGNGLMGYGTFPGMTSVQGVAMDYMWFGTGGNPANKGRTLTHEMGHFFDINHIWGDAACGDDHIADTPTQAASNSACPTFPHVSCSNGPNGDMYMNYMDYTADDCMCMFTPGQRARMIATLSPGGPRASLATSTALIPPTAVAVNWTDIFLMPQTSEYPSWKASLAMLRGWATQTSEDYNQLIRDVSGDSRRYIRGIPNELSEAIYALHLNRGTQEMTACYSASGFMEFVRGGPVVLISASSTEFYGLAVTGMAVDATSGRALLQIKDPMSIGPRGFFMTDSRGAEYSVDYNEFMTQMLEEAVRANKHIYMVRTERSSGS